LLAQSYLKNYAFRMPGGDEAKSDSLDNLPLRSILGMGFETVWCESTIVESEVV
jgi:hypothetical protein